MTTTRPGCIGNFKKSARVTAGAITKRSERMPVAVTLGGDPVFTFAARRRCRTGWMKFVCRVPARKWMELGHCKTNDLEVPANVDFVIEGYVDPGELRPEGPFGDHTGFYTAVEEYPVFHLTAITHRRTPIYPTTIVGIPPMEDFYIGNATCADFSAGVQNEFPGDCRYGAAGRRGFSQSGFRQYPETISVSGV